MGIFNRFVMKPKDNRLNISSGHMEVSNGNNNIQEIFVQTLASYYAKNEDNKLPAFATADGPYILNGFRPQLSFAGCICSMGVWHNQTVNIWTSVILIVFNIALCNYFTEGRNMPYSIYTFFWVHGCFRTLCWINSWAYHTFVCFSKNVASSLCTLDYIGCYLTPLGMGSCIIMIELYCYPLPAIFILSFGFLFIALSITMAVMPKYQSEGYRNLRLIVSICCTLPYIVGLVISIGLNHEWTIPNYFINFLLALGFELAGAFFYVSMLPERKIPGIYDCLLPSHSIWHWLNFGFDFFMLLLSSEAFSYLQNKGYCDN